MKITAVVVTYNRLALLQECIGALREQRHRPADIVVINNSSTDGTAQWLSEQPDLTTITQPNEGGASGFQRGINEGYRRGADWVWVMDDDTIATPDALEALVHAITASGDASGRPFGFFASKVIWTDGELHHRNKVAFNRRLPPAESADWYRSHGLRPIVSSTFVSTIISRAAIREVGLPFKEFFIWWDDSEYTLRISSSGFRAALVPASVVLHKTPVNDTGNYFDDDSRNLWKHRYGLRNDLYVKRHYRGRGSFYRHVVRRFVLWPFTIMRVRSQERWLFIRMAWRTTFEALSFNPPRRFADDEPV